MKYKRKLSILYTNLKTFLDEKAFVCNICGAQFKKQVSLSNHTKRHEYKENNEKVKKSIKAKKKNLSKELSEDYDMNLQITELPIEVSEELVLQDDSNGKTELIVIEEELAPQLLDGITVKLYHIEPGLVPSQE